jgi:rubrerythrin
MKSPEKLMPHVVSLALKFQLDRGRLWVCPACLAVVRTGQKCPVCEPYANVDRVKFFNTKKHG